jgi:hypothetical protein
MRSFILATILGACGLRYIAGAHFYAMDDRLRVQTNKENLR